MEIGPYIVTESKLNILMKAGKNFSQKQNPFAWNKIANILFLESPCGVGFSFAPHEYIYNDDVTATSNL